MKALIQDNAVTQYPYSFAQLRRDNPTVGYPRDPSDAKLEDWGVFEVQPSPRPDHDPITQKAEEQTPVLVDGAWTQQWTVVDLPQTEIDERLQRARQGARLTPAELRIALIRRGDLGGIKRLIGKADEETQTLWEYATFIERNHPLVAQIGEQMGYTDQQLDEMFGVQT